MKYSLFHFATKELAHSDFFAWLIKQIDPDAHEYGQDVREAALKFVNRMLTKFSDRCVQPIASLEDVKSCSVKREEEHIDVTAYIRLKDSRRIGLIIENKVGAQESRPGQLRDYFEKGSELTQNHLGTYAPEIAFIYLKSDYDFEDPLVRCDGEGARVITNFRKLDWKSLYDLFGHQKFDDSILMSYASWISEKYEWIEQRLKTDNLLGQGVGKMLASHEGQTALIKAVFSRLIGDKKPCSAEQKSGCLHIRYNCESYMKLGSNRGEPWTQLWGWNHGKLTLFYRLQMHYQDKGPEPRLHLKTYSDGQDVATDDKVRIKELYETLIHQYSLSDIWQDPNRWTPQAWETDMGSFKLVGNSIEDLKRIEDLHEELVKVLALPNNSQELCKKHNADKTSGA
jgi:hypothetical protein